MSFKDRLYKRTETTKDRRDDIQALIDSKLIALSLSDKLDMQMVAESNKHYERKDPPKRKGIAPKILKTEESVLSEEEAAEFLKKIKEKMAQGDKPYEPPPPPVFHKNYAVLAPVNPLGNKAIIFGRELFTEEAAERYFAPGADKDAFAYSGFSETAKEKIRKAYRPDSFDSRIFEYGTPKDQEGFIKQLADTLLLEFPDFKLPPPPKDITQNFGDYMRDIIRAMEAQGLDPEELVQRSRFPTPERLATEKERVRKYSLELLEETQAALTKEGSADAVKHYDRELRAYLKQHGHDPEIIHNFASGVKKLDGKKPGLEKLLEAGIEARTEEALRGAAKQMANPYDRKFIEAEKMVADNLVHSVHPRVLRNARRKKVAIMVTDNEDLRVFNDALVIDGTMMSGKYNPRFPDNARHIDDTIMLAAPGLRYDLLATIARHEFEHHRDVSGEQPFAMAYKGVLHECLADDSARLNEIHDFLKNLSKKPSPHDLKRLKMLADKRGIPADDLATSPNAVAEVRAALFEDVDKVQDWVRNTFLPQNGEQTLDVYNMKFAQLIEVPAVVEQVRGMVGTAFAKELMPRLTEAVTFHRLQNQNLRD